METAYHQYPLVKSRTSLLTYIIIAWLIAGTLDGMAAILLLAKGNAAIVFKVISGAIYGKEAFTGTGMVPLGIVLHYSIAFIFTVFYFLLFRFVKTSRKATYSYVIVYGAFIWSVMNLVVLPLTNAPAGHFTVFNVVENIAILSICVSFPIVYLKKTYDLKKDLRSEK